jgi:hypothetical protein
MGGATCSICSSGAYRNESHRKWLRIDPGGNGYAVTDLQNVSNFLPYLAPNGRRIPLLPLIVALYHDADPGLVLGTRASVSIADFASDFNFSEHELSSFFDDSPTNPLNAAITQSLGWIPGSSIGPLPAPLLPTTVPITIAQPPAPYSGPLHPVLGGTPSLPPLVNNGWDAEQYVLNTLRIAGWAAHLVSRQQLGYDIFAQRGSIKRYVEVKSSVGLCSPCLTAREWQQAKYHSQNYILAVVENFSPTGVNNIHWIPNPALRCTSNVQTSVAHAIPRTSWASATVTFAAI